MKARQGQGQGQGQRGGQGRAGEGQEGQEGGGGQGKARKVEQGVARQVRETAPSPPPPYATPHTNPPHTHNMTDYIKSVNIHDAPCDHAHTHTMDNYIDKKCKYTWNPTTNTVPPTYGTTHHQFDCTPSHAFRIAAAHQTADRVKSPLRSIT